MLKILAVMLLVFLSSNAWADDAVPACISAGVPHARLVGQGRLTYLMMDIYDARLYAPDGKVASDGPLALNLTYLRPVSGARIADTSIEEIRKQGFDDEITLAGCTPCCLNIIPDVTTATVLTGLRIKRGRRYSTKVTR